MADTYLKDATSLRPSTNPLHRVVEAIRDFDREHEATVRAREVADISTRKARELADNAVTAVRRRPAPFIAGALGLIALGVGAALLANPRSRAAGAKMAKDAWSLYEKRKPF